MLSANPDVEKLNKLKDILSEMKIILIAYSGGVDSNFLLKVASEIENVKVLAVTAQSNTYPQREVEEAIKNAKLLNIEHILIETNELDNENFTSNSPQRCYYCKNELFSKLIDIAKQRNIKYVIDGSNYDDLSDHRPGMKAACELGVRSPLQEVELTKEDIRLLSKELGLATWEKPSFACLSSRFPYGTKITKEELEMVDKAEQCIRHFGINQVRVRSHGTIARIEIPKEQIPYIVNDEIRKKIISKLKEIGYKYVTIDLEGYRTGSMNEVLEKK